MCSFNNLNLVQTRFNAQRLDAYSISSIVASHPAIYTFAVRSASMVKSCQYHIQCIARTRYARPQTVEVGKSHFSANTLPVIHANIDRQTSASVSMPVSTDMAITV